MRVAIIGCSGSGKSWLASKLAEILEVGPPIPVHNLDNIYFVVEEGSHTRRDKQEVAELIDKSKESTPNWVVEGVFGELIEQYLDLTDSHLPRTRMGCLQTALAASRVEHGED